MPPDPPSAVPSNAKPAVELDVEQPVPDAETSAAAADILARSNLDATAEGKDYARLFPTDQTETSRPGEAVNPRPATPKMDDVPPGTNEE